MCDEAIKAKKIDGRNSVTHILFLIQLPQQEVKSHFVGFQSDPWISVHIDDLRPTSQATVVPEQALLAKISEQFKGELEAKAEPAEPVDRANKSKVVYAQHRRLLGCVQAAVSMLKDSEQDRSMLRIEKLLSLIPKTMADRCGKIIIDNPKILHLIMCVVLCRTRGYVILLPPGEVYSQGTKEERRDSSRRKGLGTDGGNER